MQRFFTAAIAWMAATTFAPAELRANIELKVDRFFDPCIEANTNIERASGEACIIQAIFNAFSAEKNDITVDLLPSQIDNYYPRLIESYAGEAPPDVHLLHRHRLSDFAGAGLLAPLEDDLTAAGIDIADWEPAARDAVTFNDEIVAVPFDIHANLWHINLSLLTEAGLVAKDGRPILPASPGELLEHAQQVKEVTGKAYLAADFAQFPIGVRAVLSLLWQQDKNVVEGEELHIDTPEMRAAITTFTDLFDAGLANPAHTYETAQQTFLNGDVAVLINGTWAVDLYDQEVAQGEIALADYDVADFPTLFDRSATWADWHLWAVPVSLKTNRPDAYSAAIELLSWINDHNLDWARTGHLAVRTSVLESEAYATLSHRLDYRTSADIGQDLPVVSGYEEIHEILSDGLKTIWLDGVPIDDALATAEASIRQFMQ